jgi:hypothetical protein
LDVSLFYRVVGGVLAVGLIGLGFMLLGKWYSIRRREKVESVLSNPLNPQEVEAWTPTYIPRFNPEGKAELTPVNPDTAESETLEQLLAGLLKQAVERGNVQLEPEISLSCKDKFKIYDKEWDGEVSFKLAKKQREEKKEKENRDEAIF